MESIHVELVALTGAVGLHVLSELRGVLGRPISDELLEAVVIGKICTLGAPHGLGLRGLLRLENRLESEGVVLGVSQLHHMDGCSLFGLKSTPKEEGENGYDRKEESP